MKRYAVVAYHSYYPDPCLDNIRAAFDDEATALKVALEIKNRRMFDHVSVVDMETFTPDHPWFIQDILKDLGISCD